VQQFKHVQRIFVVLASLCLLSVHASIVLGQDSQPGASLIGELEGPTIILDESQFPSTYSEAPTLSEQVERGELPPVEERLPNQPLVIQPLDQIGVYGGTIRRAFTGPGDGWNGRRILNDRPLFFSYDMREVVPNMALDWEVSEDGRETTLYLREGLKWSDGEPLTADDFMFWYNHVYLNDELVGTPTAAFAVNGKPGSLEKIDDYTLSYTFEEPNFIFPEILAGFANISSHASWGWQNMGGFAPAHYLEQYHPDFVDRDALIQEATEEGFDDWTTYFTFRNNVILNTELPVATAWRTVQPINENTWILERNPYYWAVDTEGNQLPYIDRITFTLAEDLEVLNLRAIAGEVDFQSRHIDLQKLPLYLENQDDGNYTIRLDPGEIGSNVSVRFNLSYQDDEYIGDLFRNRDFRRAMSLAFDREQLNEIFFLGLGTSGSPIPSPANVYYPGDEYRTLWHSFDVDQANTLLDELGLTERNEDGIRLRADNGEPLRLSVVAVSGSFIPYPEIAEVLREQLQEVGIALEIQVTERSLANTLFEGNQHQMHLWDNGNTDRFFSPTRNLFPIDNYMSMGPLYGQWFASNGEQGLEPIPELAAWMEQWRTAASLPETERVELGQELWATYVDEVWVSGLVGLSPATLGVRIVSNDIGNVPERQIVGTDPLTPSISRPETFYFAQ